MRKIIALLVVGVVGLAAVFFGRSFLATPTDFMTLDPGPFRAAYLIEDNDADFDLLQLIVQAGEVDHDGPEGLAHYVEHLAWIDQLTVTGAKTSRHSNAWASQLATSYFVSGPTEDMAKNLERLATTAKPFALQPSFITEERGIVLREYHLRAGESATRPIWLEMEALLFEGSPMARTALGTPETIAEFNGEIAADLHAKTHSLSNMVLIAHGKMKAGDLSREIEKLGVSDPYPLTPIPSIPTATLRDEGEFNGSKISADKLFYDKVVPLPDGPATPQTTAAIWVLDSILDSTLPGGVATPLRFDNFIAASFDFDLYQQAPDSLRLSFSARPDVDVDLKELQAAFEEVMVGIYENGIPQESFDRVKKQQLDDLEDTKNKPRYTLSNVVQHTALRRTPWGYSSDLKAMNDLSLEDVNVMLKALSSEGRVVIRRVRAPQ